MTMRATQRPRARACLGHAHRGREERGNALVEFAIVGVLLMLLVFGIVEFGLTIHSNISLSNSVREASREAVVANYNGGDTSCSGAPAAQLACFIKHNSGLSNTDVRVFVNFPTGTSYAVGQEVAVCASYPMTSITGLLSSFLAGRYLHSETKMRLEQAPGTSPGTYADAAPDGWAWCN
jgi:Flp pilus assembly protein TadG